MNINTNTFFSSKPDKFFYLSVFILGIVFFIPLWLFGNSYNESSKIVESYNSRVLGENINNPNILSESLFVSDSDSSFAEKSNLKNQNDYFNVLYSKDFLKLLESRTIDLNYANQYKAVYKDKPEKITGAMAVDIGSGSLATLSWAKFNEPPDRIEIYRSLLPSNLGELIANLSGKENGYHDLTIKKNEIYYYTIITFNQAGQTSVPVKIAVGPIKDIEPPASPFDIKILSLQDDLGFKITWQNPTASDLAYINIYRSTEKGVLSDRKLNGNFKILARVRENNEYEDKNVEPNIYYYYTLTAVDEDGNESLKDLPGSVPITGNPNLFSPPF